ncbi:unnamed protein product [Brassica oleracea var. botrytis]|uniref:(rape) hypothetical protein n=1 Tax=Brassica napus TaxID=3708 RepID=A0A816RB56_BRANA|nr:unnamed protein product [Brassica napus]
MNLLSLIPVIILLVSPNVSICVILIQQQTLDYCVDVFPLSLSVCGFHYVTLKTFCFQLRFDFHQWIWDPGITKLSLTFCGIEMWKDFSNSRVKLLAVKAVMIAHPKAEWFWWIDYDESFIVMEFMASLHYRYQNLVVYGWPCITYVIQSWIVVNADVFHIGNCQWSMEIIDTWKSMGPASLEYAKWGSIQKTTSKDKLFPKSDDLIVHFGGIYGDNIEWGTLEWNVVNDDKKGYGDTSNVWCYWFQSKRISMPWIVTTKHVISCSGSVWDGLRCNT